MLSADRERTRWASDARNDVRPISRFAASAIHAGWSRVILLSILRACETLRASASKPQTVDGRACREVESTSPLANPEQPEQLTAAEERGVIGEFTSVMKAGTAPVSFWPTLAPRGRHGIHLGRHAPRPRVGDWRGSTAVCGLPEQTHEAVPESGESKVAGTSQGDSPSHTSRLTVTGQ